MAAAAARLLGAALLVLYLSLLPGTAAAPLALGTPTDGTAVAFGGPADGQDPNVPTGGLLDGSCGYGLIPRARWPFWSVVAVSPASAIAANTSAHPLSGCGRCLAIECVNDRPGYEGRCAPGAGNLMVQIVDTCVSCPPDRIALPYSTLSQHLADPGAGPVAVRWRQVECAPPNNLTLDIDQYRADEGGYIRLALEGLAGSGGVMGVELRRSPSVSEVRGVMSIEGTVFKPMNNTYGARWELSGLPEPPLDLRVIGDNGQEALLARRAITQAGVTGRFVTAVQFSTAEVKGVSDATSDPAATLAVAAPCNETIYSFLQSRPDLSRLVELLDTAGITPLLQQADSQLTLMAPNNAAWDGVPRSVDLNDKETLQAVLLFLVAQGQVVLPDASDMLPEDVASGGVRLAVDTLNGKRFTVVAHPDAITIDDGSALTLVEPLVVPTSHRVCTSVVNILSGVPLPF